MQSVPVRLVDCFTSTLLGGNIAGVVGEADRLRRGQMQAIASELSAPTTAFARKRGDKEYEVKFFTPVQEIDMCGHAVVGTFTALALEGKLDFHDSDRIDVSLLTRAGVLPVEIRHEDDRPVFVAMNQRSPVYRNAGVETIDIATLLGVSPETIEDRYPIEIVSTALRHLFVPVRSLEVLRTLKPNYRTMSELSKKLNVETVDVFTVETINPSCTVHSRDFCPAIGNPEEAASGTTNGALSCYLIKNNALPKIGSDQVIIIVAEQGYEMGRPSIIRTEITVEDNKIEHVKVGGAGVLSLKGELRIED